MGTEDVGIQPRIVPLSHGRTLVVRAMEPDDAEGVRLLYEGLNADDRYRRFFSGFRPSHAFVERWVHVRERGGVGLVAVVQAPGASDEIVAEAVATPLPNGNAEFAMTIAAPHRGWLGPYLLDVLAEEAAAAGFENLEADVLLDNRPMLTVIAARGHAVASHEDVTAVRLVIGTRGPTPRWVDPAGAPRPLRVLVEVPGGRWVAAEAANAAGLAVLACPGPRGRLGPRCPVLDGGRCPLADEADLVVCSLPATDAVTTTLVDAHRAAGLPVLTPADDERLAPGSTAAAVLAAVREALERSGAGRAAPPAGGAPAS